MKLYIIAGEESGELHGKNLIKAFSRLQPGIQWRGMGGDGMQAAGVQLVKHIRDTNFMGFSMVLKNLGTIRKMFKEVKADILDFQPQAVILIDYPGFNLRMAKWLHSQGIRVFFYISPQVWAWKTSRVKKVRAYVERMYVILPFEAPFYQQFEVEVDFVGHPLLDELDQRTFDTEGLKSAYQLDDRPVVALLPGSRAQEIKRMLPVMLAQVDRFPGHQFVIAGAPSQSLSFYQELVGDQPVTIVQNRTYDLLSLAQLALVTSGTATLETALFKVPEVVCYAGPWASVLLARWLVGNRLKYISLVNLIMDREVVKELIQQDLTPGNLEKELRKFTSDPAALAQIKSDYQALRAALGDSGASSRTASLILERLHAKDTK